MNHVEQLTELQKGIGYMPGSLSPVAVLGLMGECGEVAKELLPSAVMSGLDSTDMNIVSHHYAFNMALVDFFTLTARKIDDAKKQIRNSELLATSLHYHAENDDAFDEELADLFYYLNAVAISRGLTIEDLARTSYAKVMRKRETVGPELTGR